MIQVLITIGLSVFVYANALENDFVYDDIDQVVNYVGCVVMITHDMSLADKTDRIIRLKDGMLERTSAVA